MTVMFPSSKEEAVTQLEQRRSNCKNHDICQGTGCYPKKYFVEMIDLMYPVYPQANKQFASEEEALEDIYERERLRKRIQHDQETDEAKRNSLKTEDMQG